MTSFPPDHPDRVVVDGLRRGDHEVFRTLVTELNAGLARLAATYVPAAIADEVVQETWMAVVRSIDTFEGRSSLKSWIYRIMLNKVRTVAKRESKIVPFTSLGPRSEADSPSVAADRLAHPELGQGYWPEAPTRWDTLPVERLEAHETRSQIDRAIRDLPAAQREVITLRDVEGWSADEVCAALGLSAVNQRVLLHRGRSAVRKALEDHFS